ncbi:MAG: FACT complex subunit spt16 [Bogoriella megaspora]|nr:MAG: FACT complex subunit spt16 [Bogoriella megaspora]
MADEVSIDKTTFHNRLASFISLWKRSGDSLFGGASSAVILHGKTDDAANFRKANGFQFWLLGYEFPATLFVITQSALHVVTTKKKASYLEALKGGKTPVEIHVRSKDAEQNAKQLEECVEIIKSAGKKVGVLTKDPATGPFVDEWKAAIGDASKELEDVDMAVALSTAMAVKDENELRSIRDASKASSAIMKGYLSDQLASAIDSGAKITHKTFAAKVQNKIDDTKFLQGLKVSANFDPQQLDWNVSPIIQSGGKYDLKQSAAPDDSNLHEGVVIAQLGLRYMTYSSVVARTFMVDPNKSQENAYKLLLSVHETVIKEIRDGAVAKEIYAKAIGAIKAKKPELEKHFVSSVGYGIGIEARDTTLSLNAKNSRSLKDGMTLSITTGFQDIENPKPQDKKSNTYSLLLTDTIRVTRGETFVFTNNAPSDLETNAFYFKDDEEAEPKKPKKEAKATSIAQSNIQKTRLRTQGSKNTNEEKEAARREHQKELHNKKRQQGLERFKDGVGDLNGTEEKKFKRFESYKRDNQLPSRIKDLVIVVDAKNSSVVLPIMGRPVPFHINTIKNASRTDEGEFTYLRINFLSPGQGVGRKDDQPFEDPTAQFVRSLTFRSKDIDRMEDITNQITELKKSVVKKEQEKKQMEDVVEQDKLVEIRARRPYALDTVFLRPAMDGKRVPGRVEIHQNGLRYIHGLGGSHATVDVLFSNIKHLFFQPSAHELIIIIHVHLINPILIGKKKTRDVQFYREATEMAFDETGNRKRKHRYGDEEEFEAEQEERRKRAQLDKEFKSFAEKISDAGKNDQLAVDVPFRELAFNGVPSRSSVTVQPTTDCLVQLTEPPFLVITLADIEIVHIERAQFGLKNRDMVVVFKDFNRPPAHINTIPVENIDTVKDWLDSVEIPFSEGPLNLNWSQIMKTVLADPKAFYADGGWNFLAADSDDENKSESEAESAFEMSDSDLAAASESSEDDSEFDEEASAEASEEDVSGEDDEGEDWDEMEAKAKKKDREGGLDDEDRGRKKKR